MLPPWKKGYGQPRPHSKKHSYFFANKGPSSQSYGFSNSQVWMWELDYKESWELMLLNCDVGEDTWESLRLQEILPVYSKGNQTWIFIEKDCCWSWNWNTLATWCEVLTHWKRPWCWERLKVRGEVDSRGWDDWMASLTRWTWVSASSWNWWWTGMPGVLQSMGSQIVGQGWTKLTDPCFKAINIVNIIICYTTNNWTIWGLRHWPSMQWKICVYIYI